MENKKLAFRIIAIGLILLTMSWALIQVNPQEQEHNAPGISPEFVEQVRHNKEMQAYYNLQVSLDEEEARIKSQQIQEYITSDLFSN